MVNIVVHGQLPFPVGENWTVADAEERIRTVRGLVNGYIARNGIALRRTEQIQDGDEFREFQLANQGKSYIADILLLYFI